MHCGTGRIASVIAVTAITLSACGGGDEASSTTDTATPSTSAATTVAPTTAPATTTPPTTAAAPPPTTAPATTAPPPTTAPLATTPTTAPSTAPVTDDLAQFCFDSEQTYIANAVLDRVDDPSPEAVEAAVRFLAFTVVAAAESAPAELAAEPERAVFLVDEIGEFFADYDFDVETIPDEAVEEVTPVVDEYTSLMARLQQFLSESCDSPIDTLDAQAAKLQPVVTELITWDLIPVANQAGDVRMLVPESWNEWFGSDELTLDVSFLQASPDLRTFEESWSVPGGLVTVLYDEPGTAEPATIVPETAAATGCTEVSVELYDDPVYTGELHRYTNCGDIDTEAIVLAVTDADASREIVVELQFPGGADNAFVEQFLASFAAG